MSAMERSGTTKLHIKQGPFELELQRSEGEVHSHHLREDSDTEEGPHSARGALRKGGAALPRSADRAAPLQAEEEKPQPSSPGVYITSPMVGTFYSGPSPEDPPFMKVGDVIEKGQVICIIEAMKVMNEIKAQSSGTIVEVCLENGHPVEFGTKLFRIQ